MGKLAEFCSIVNKVITEKRGSIPCQVSMEDIRHSYPGVFKPSAEKIGKNIFYILYSDAIGGRAGFLCSSCDIGDGIEQGDYEYYFGTDRDDMTAIGYIYMYSHHSKTYPSRVMFYMKNYLITMIKDGEDLLMHPLDPGIYDMMMDLKDDTRRDKIIDHLRNINRQSNR